MERFSPGDLTPTPLLKERGFKAGLAPFSFRRRAGDEVAQAQTLQTRLRILRALRHGLAAHPAPFLEAVRGETNRPDSEILTSEILPLAEACRFLEREAPRILATRRLGVEGRPAWLTGVESEVRREPLGTVLVIGPSNYPLFLPGVQTLQALAAGNAVLWKPGTGGLAAARAFATLARHAGLAAGRLTILSEDPQAARDAIASGVDKVLLTGSSATGRDVLSQLASTLTPATMELSGQDPLFVLPGADLDRVARALRFGLTLNHGTTCIAPRRVFVARELAAGLTERLQGLPEIPVRPFGSVEEALAEAARNPYALGASIFGPEKDALDLADRVHAGAVVINDVIVPTADPRLPFGGRGESGYGVTRGEEGLLDLTVPKVVAVRRGRRLPHLEEPHPADADLFQAYMRLVHGGGLGARMQGALGLIRNLAGRKRRSPHLPGPPLSGGEEGERQKTHFEPSPSGRGQGEGPAPIGIIGGGLAGLASAVTLAARGYRVILFERNPWLGGKAAVLAEGGFRFDMGPTILTLPSVLGRIFAEAGRDLRRELDLVPLDPQWRCFYEDGSTLDLTADPARMEATLNAFAPRSGAAEGYRRFLQVSERLHGVSERFFFWRSVGSIADTFDAGTTFKPSILGDLLALRFGRTVAGTVRSHVPEPRVAQMLDHFTQYVGSAPDASPAVLCGIAHMQTQEGIWYPRGGTRAVPEALHRLATELGVEIRTGTGVRRILIDGGAVSGIETDGGERVPLSALISNCDSVRTHRELLDGTRAARRFEKRRKYEPACSGVVLYLGLNRAYPHLLHHNFVFSHDPEEEFDAIYRRGEPAADPTCYLCAPAATDPAVAPAGGEALYVLVHTPYLRPHHDWQAMFPTYRRTILEKLAKTAGLEDLEDRIVFESALTPEDIHTRYHVLNGAIYGLASHGRLLGAFKPGNRSRDLKGLYLAGGAAHPGPGMPMVLMSGWIAADVLDKDGVVERSASVVLRQST